MGTKITIEHIDRWELSDLDRAYLLEQNGAYVDDGYIFRNDDYHGGILHQVTQVDDCWAWDVYDNVDGKGIDCGIEGNFEDALSFVYMTMHHWTACKKG